MKTEKRTGRSAYGMISLFLLLLLVVLFSGVIFPGTRKAFALPSPPKPAPDSIVTISMSFVGDLMCHVPQINNARHADGTFDFSPSFKEIAPYISSADLAMGNLETTCAGPWKSYGGYPAFNSPDAYIAAVKSAGFDFLCTANNHSMDTGEEGLLRTVGVVRKNGLGSTGTFLSQRDRDSIRVLDVRGIKIAVLNYTYGTNGAYPSAEHKYMLNVADSALVHDDILKARSTGADIVLVFYHWGIENQRSPVPKQDTMFHWAADAGADLIIGSHPHVIEPVKYFKTAANATLDSGFVAWSLGNFLSNQYWRYTDAGVILSLSLQKNFTTGKVSLAKTSYLPTWVYRSYDPSLQEHVVVPAGWCGNDSLPAWINADSKQKMCEAFGDTQGMLGSAVSGMELRSVK
ncbi:MAG TPA: CapA family protein [Bacteroidia bacterium]|nr:CapA family protein [Bacteroidia bacterium]